MPLNVATEAGLADANAYATVEAADAYLNERGRSGWTDETPERKQRLLIQATDYMDRRWGRLLVGVRLTDAQRLEWPRAGFGIPADVVEACIEYAHYATAGHLFIEYGDAGSVRTGESATAGQRVTRRREKIGPIDTKVVYASGATVQQTARGDLAAVAGRYPNADALMQRYVRRFGRVIRG